MYYSESLYLALKMEESFRDYQYELCVEYFEGFNVSEELYNDAFETLDIVRLYDTESWAYRIHEEAIEIKGKITFDMELYFTVNQARGLYKLDEPEYQAICELSAGLYEPFTRENYEDQQDFELAIVSLVS